MAPRGADDPRSARDTRARGRAIEAQVAAHLQTHGLVILEANVELAHAELDLVARDERASEPTIVFVEVRSRSDDTLGHPSETIGPDKRARIIRAATAWLVANGLWERVAVRFDVVTVVGNDEAARALEWLRAAFDVDG